MGGERNSGRPGSIKRRSGLRKTTDGRAPEFFGLQTEACLERRALKRARFCA